MFNPYCSQNPVTGVGSTSLAEGSPLVNVAALGRGGVAGRHVHRGRLGSRGLLEEEAVCDQVVINVVVHDRRIVSHDSGLLLASLLFLFFNVLVPHVAPALGYDITETTEPKGPGRVNIARLGHGDGERSTDGRGRRERWCLDRAGEPPGCSARLGEEVFRVALVVGDDAELADRLGGSGVEGLGPGEGTVVNHWALDGWEDVQEADADGPDVSLGRGVTRTGRIVLLRGHVTVAADSGLEGPLVFGGETKVTQLHGAGLGEEDVLRLDIAVIDAHLVDVRDSIHKFEHELTDVLCLEGAVTVANRLIQVTSGAELENQVRVRLRLEGTEEIDNVVVGQAAVQLLLFRLVVNRKGHAFVVGIGRLGKALDGDCLASEGILGLEDHAERARVERGECLVAAVEEEAALEVVSKARHCVQSLAGKQITQSAGASDVMQAAFDVLSVTKEGLASVK
ncbi:hypothetical protein HYQ46_006434 [Verticillium longisporum]|nr:hypothetical protein HYQ46_006434 [Verticillium longisporum]